MLHLNNLFFTVNSCLNPKAANFVPQTVARSTNYIALSHKLSSSIHCNKYLMTEIPSESLMRPLTTICSLSANPEEYFLGTKSASSCPNAESFSASCIKINFINDNCTDYSVFNLMSLEGNRKFVLNPNAKVFCPNESVNNIINDIDISPFKKTIIEDIY